MTRRPGRSSRTTIAPGHRAGARRRRAVATILATAGLAAAVAPATVGPARGQEAVTSASPSPASASPAPGDAVTPPSGTGAPAHVAEEVAAVLARFPELTSQARVAVTVLDAEGETVWRRDGDRGLLPASTMKALTAASVLDTFGLDGTIATTVASTAPVGPDGTLDGPLVLQGRGDPTMTSDDYRRWIYPSRPATAIEDLADAVVEAGVRRVTKSVVGDGTAFGPASTAAAGWPERYLADYDAHNLSALTIDTGRRVDVDTGGGGAATVTTTQDPDPPLRTAVLFARALADRGVVVGGRVASVISPRIGATEPVASVDSPPMEEVVRFMLRESDNHLADQLVRAASLESSGDGSWVASGDRVRDTLASAGVGTTGFVLSDGSGLSRTNRVSTDLLAANDRAQYDRWGPAWSGVLAQASVSGTLENRLLGTSAEGRLFGKTGTLDDVRGLAGHVVARAPGDAPADAAADADDDAASGHYHFALLVNDVPGDIRWQASVVGDELALVLADALDGCRRTRVVEVPAPAATDEATDAPSTPSPDTASTGDATPTQTPSPATVRRRVTATPDDPGPNLSSDDWTRDCATG